MKVQVIRPISIDGADYRPGFQEMPDKLASHPFFLACKNNGYLLAVELPSAKAKALAPIAKRADVVAEEPELEPELEPSEEDDLGLDESEDGDEESSEDDELEELGEELDEEPAEVSAAPKPKKKLKLKKKKKR